MRVAVGTGVAVAVAVAVGMGVLVAVGVGVAVGVAVGMSVAVSVGDAVTVGSGVAAGGTAVAAGTPAPALKTRATGVLVGRASVVRRPPNVLCGAMGTAVGSSGAGSGSGRLVADGSTVAEEEALGVGERVAVAATAA